MNPLSCSTAPLKLTLLGLVMVMLNACATAQYSALEKLGIHKRDILVDRIEAVQETQQETKEQFISAYEQLKALTGGGDKDLENHYNALDKTVKRSESRAEELNQRIDSVEQVANALFDEWQGELEQYSNSTLRANSAANLKQTQARYAQMLNKMRQAESKIMPVLRILQDNTLFMKHNLNASAIASLQGEVLRIEADISALIGEMDSAINEAQRFIDGSASG